MKIKCLTCGDILQSTHRRDFKRCSCGKIFIDGGPDHPRVGHSGPYQILPEREE